MTPTDPSLEESPQGPVPDVAPDIVTTPPADPEAGMDVPYVAPPPITHNLESTPELLKRPEEPKEFPKFEDTLPDLGVPPLLDKELGFPKFEDTVPTDTDPNLALNHGNPDLAVKLYQSHTPDPNLGAMFTSAGKMAGKAAIAGPKMLFNGLYNIFGTGPEGTIPSLIDNFIAPPLGFVSNTLNGAVLAATGTPLTRNAPAQQAMLATGAMMQTLKSQFDAAKGHTSLLYDALLNATVNDMAKPATKDQILYKLQSDLDREEKMRAVSEGNLSSLFNDPTVPTHPAVGVDTAAAAKQGQMTLYPLEGAITGAALAPVASLAGEMVGDVAPMIARGAIRATAATVGGATEGAGALMQNIPKHIYHFGSMYEMLHGNFGPAAATMAAKYALPVAGRAVSAAGRAISAGATLESPALDSVLGAGGKLLGRQAEGMVHLAPYAFAEGDPEAQQSVLNLGAMFGTTGAIMSGVRTGLMDSILQTPNGPRLQFSDKPFDYTSDPYLDAEHNKESSTWSAGAIARINQMRSALHGAAELYGLSPEAYKKEVGDDNSYGVMQPDGPSGRKIILYNGEDGFNHARMHEPGHIMFDSLDDAAQQKLAASMIKFNDPTKWYNQRYLASLYSAEGEKGNIPKIDSYDNLDWDKRTKIGTVNGKDIFASQKDIISEMAAEAFNHFSFDKITKDPNLLRQLQFGAARMMEAIGIPMTPLEIQSTMGVQPSAASIMMLEGVLRDVVKTNAGKERGAAFEPFQPAGAEGTMTAARFTGEHPQAPNFILKPPIGLPAPAPRLALKDRQVGAGIAGLPIPMEGPQENVGLPALVPATYVPDVGKQLPQLVHDLKSGSWGFTKTEAKNKAQEAVDKIRNLDLKVPVEYEDLVKTALSGSIPKHLMEESIKPPEPPVAPEEPSAAQSELETGKTPPESSTVSKGQYRHLVRKSKAGNELTEPERQQVLAYEEAERTKEAPLKDQLSPEELAQYEKMQGLTPDERDILQRAKAQQAEERRKAGGGPPSPEKEVPEQEPPLRAPAIRTKDGQIFYGKDWTDARKKAQKEGVDLTQEITKGYTDVNGNFLDAEQAKEYAKKIGQIPPEAGGKDLRPNEWRMRNFMPKPQNPEAIAGTAIRDETGKVYRGSSPMLPHGIIDEEHNLPEDRPAEYGYVNNNGDFRTRDQAYQDVLKHGQMTRRQLAAMDKQQGSVGSLESVSLKRSQGGQLSLNEIYQKAVDSIKSDGGITIDIRGNQPDIGFAFAPSKGTHTEIPMSKLSEDHLADFAKRHFAELRKPDTFLGGWDDGKGNAVLDLSNVHSDELESLVKAQHASQDAIFNLGEGKEIPVNERIQSYTPEQIRAAQEKHGIPTQAPAIGDEGAVREEGSGVSTEERTAEATDVGAFMPKYASLQEELAKAPQNVGDAKIKDAILGAHKFLDELQASKARGVPTGPLEKAMQEVIDDWQSVLDKRAEARGKARTGSSGIWDSMQGGEEGDLLAQDLGIDAGKRYYEQKPAARAIIDDYFKSRGEAQYMPKPDDREAIKEAAVKTADGRIWTGVTHTEAHDKIYDANLTDKEMYPFETGFVTNSDEYLNREAAAQRAKERGQIHALSMTRSLDANQVRFMPKQAPQTEEFKRWSEGAPVVLNSGVSKVAQGRTGLKMVKNGDAWDLIDEKGDPFIQGIKTKAHAEYTLKDFVDSEANRMASKDQLPKFQTGSPVVVGAYHGSPSDTFHVFDESKLGSYSGAPSAKRGFFFSGNPETAKSYQGTLVYPYKGFSDMGLKKRAEFEVFLQDAMGDHNREIYSKRWQAVNDPASNWYKVIDNEEKPLHTGLTYEQARNIVSDHNQYEGPNKVYTNSKEFLDDHSDLAKQIAKNITGNDFNMEPASNTMHEVYVKFKNPMVKDFKGDHYREETYNNLLKRAKEAGHDGAIFTNTYDGGGNPDNIFVTFSNKNIKSTANMGTFDPQNPDIRFMPKDHPDAIKEPAFQTRDGEIISAPVGYHSMIPFTKEQKLKDIWRTGFVTNKGEFLDRKQALARALEHDQISKAAADPRNWTETAIDQQLHAPDVKEGSTAEPWQYMPKDKAPDIDLEKKPWASPEQFRLATNIATEAHKDQKYGQAPYINHPAELSHLVNDELKPAAILHDVLEDSDLTKQDLIDKGIHPRTAETADALTRRPNESYADYIQRVKLNPDARQIKILDNYSNLKTLPEDSTLRKRYVKAMNDLLVPEEELAKGLDASGHPEKSAKIGAARDLPAGTPISIRLDVPAYNATGVHVNTTHSGNRGPVLGYDNITTIDNPVFKSNEEAAARIAFEGRQKGVIAATTGEFNPSRTFPDDIGDYALGGYNPKKHSYLYEKGSLEETGVATPIESGSQAIHQGSNVFVKDPVYGAPEEHRFMPKDIGEMPAYINEYKRKHPDSIPITFMKGKDGEYRFVKNQTESKKAAKLGLPAVYEAVPQAYGYDLDQTPLAKQASKGIKDEGEARKAVVGSYADKVERDARKALGIPEVDAARGWYRIFNEKIKAKLDEMGLGQHIDKFMQLVSASSPQNEPWGNFAYAVNAWNEWRKGNYDDLIKRYHEEYTKFRNGELTLANGKPMDKVGQFERHLKSLGIRPKQAHGALFGKNSDKVMHALAGTFLDTAGKLKIHQFVHNLLQEDLNATIDMWAGRTMHRVGWEDSGQKRWRMLPFQESGVSDTDFKLGQDVFKEVAKRLDLTTDDLQALMWFYEKKLWYDNKWSAKLDYGDFRHLTQYLEPEHEKGTFKYAPDIKAYRSATRGLQPYDKGTKRANRGDEDSISGPRGGALAPEIGPQAMPKIDFDQPMPQTTKPMSGLFAPDIAAQAQIGTARAINAQQRKQE